MYEYGGFLFNEAGQIVGVAPSRQDFGQQAMGVDAILQPFDANLGNISTGSVGPAFTGGFDLSQFNTNELFVAPQTPQVDIVDKAPDMLKMPKIGDFSAPTENLQLAGPTPAYGGSNTKFPGFFERLGHATGLNRLGGGEFGSRFAKGLGSPAGMMGIASGLGGIIGGLFGRGKRRDAQIAAQGEYDRMKAQYMDLDTSNIYANVRNKYLNMENTFEDLTVNQQQAEFERSMFEQQQANIMSNLRGAAGGSGIAGLAQALSNQALVQSQKAAGSIGLQESRNQILKAREASKIQFAERGGEAQAEAMRLAGAETARGLEYQKTGTLFGMAQQDLAAANAAIAASDAALYGGIGQLAGTVLTAGIGAI